MPSVTLGRSVRALFPVASLAFPLLVRAATIEFDYFYPDRYQGADAMKLHWGEPYTWPIKTFPHWWYDQEKKLDKTYGLVYWPGEKVTVHVLGGAADKVTCTHAGTGAALPVDKVDASTWTIRTMAAEELRGAPYGKGTPDSANHGYAAAFDGDPRTFCQFTEANGGYVGVDLGPQGASAVTAITFAPRVGWYAANPRAAWQVMKGGRFQGSNGDKDDGPWTDLAAIADEPSQYVATTLPVTVPAAFRYLRYLGADGSYGIIADIHFAGPAKGGNPLDVYRVRASQGNTEVASRGLVVTKPWSGVRLEKDNPYFARKVISLGEWRNGGNPFDQMCYYLGANPEDGTYFPMRDRPWGEVDTYGLPEFYWFRWDYTSANTNWYHPDLNLPLPDGDFYKDPSFEWNLWWTWYGRGLSKWYGNWNWGPFSQMAAERIDKDNYDICYRDVRKISGAMPNGLLFWQWGYYGLERLSAHEGAHSGQPEVTFGLYDGWSTGSGEADWAWADEVGMIPLYYERCKAQGLDKTWADRPDFGRFMDAQWKAYEPGWRQYDIDNDFLSRYRIFDLSRGNFRILETAARDAYKEIAGAGAPGYHSQETLEPIWEGAAFTGMGWDRRAIGQAWIDGTGGGYGPNLTGINGSGDYSHEGWVRERALGYFANSRYYRGRGFLGATSGALWPQTYFGGGYRHGTTSDGCGYMPGSYAYFHGDNAKVTAYVHGMIDDGGSFRRKDMFERVPMFYRPGGQLAGYEAADAFGTNEYDPSDSARWNVQGILGMQLMEIPDRLRPVGGVVVVDSKNKADRDAKKEFLTEDAFSDYLAAVMDSLGIAAYANPDVLKDVPADLPRIYVPRKDGTDQGWLMADVGGKRIKVAYDGQADQLPASAHFRDFVAQVKAAQSGGWPLRASGGFAAVSWESSRGQFVYVENPMDSGAIHVPRRGQVTVRVRGLKATPAVYDLCGLDPDPRRLDSAEAQANGEWVTLKLDWPKGDGRLYWIDAALPVSLAPRAGGRGADPMRARRLGDRLEFAFLDAGPHRVRVFGLDGRQVWERRGQGPERYAVPAASFGHGLFVARVEAGGRSLDLRFLGE